MGLYLESSFFDDAVSFAMPIPLRFVARSLWEGLGQERLGP